MPKLRRPSPSMIVALTALVVALGGTAFAAGVVINGNLLKNGSVTGKKLKRDTLTGHEIKESTLGKVPRAASADRATVAVSAAKLGSLDPTAFVQGGGRTFAASKTLSAGTTTDTPAFVIPGIGTATMTCDGSSITNIQLNNGTGATGDESISLLRGSSVHADGLPVPPGSVMVGATTSGVGQAHVLFLWPTGSTEHALDLTVGWYANFPSGCTAIAEGVVR